MKKSEFRTPLIQSGAVLVAIVFIISLIPSGDGLGVGAVIGALVSGIFKLFLFLVALVLSIGVAIAVMIGIFLAAIALKSPQQAADIWSETKVRLAGLIQNTLACRAEAPSCATVNSQTVETGISQEEYDQMKSMISSLQNANSQLQGEVAVLSSTNSKLQEDITSLTTMVDELKESETKIKELISELSAKVKEEPDAELVSQIARLEEMVIKTNGSITDLAGRLAALEEAATVSGVDTVSGGIFAYFESEDQRTLFINAVTDGVAKELTYAQFDEFLTESLPADLDKVIKDHPSLTKDYIRSMRSK